MAKKWPSPPGGAHQSLRSAALQGATTVGSGSLDVSKAIIAADGQRNGRAEEVLGIVMPLDGDQSLGVPTEAVGRPCRIVGGEQIRIPAGQGRRVEGVARGAGPLLMALLLLPVAAIGESG